MFFWLTQKPHPVRHPPLCRRGAGGEAVPRKRENQINTLVLKDINFTINIIDCLITERLIPWINLKCSRGTASPNPSKEGMSLTLLTYFHRFKLYAIRTSPPSEGLGEAFFLVGLLPCLWSSVVFTPLSIRRGGGGEAFLLLPRRIIHIHLQLL